jgi:hypothetical protein
MSPAKNLGGGGGEGSKKNFSGGVIKFYSRLGGGGGGAQWSAFSKKDEKILNLLEILQRLVW